MMRFLIFPPFYSPHLLIFFFSFAAFPFFISRVIIINPIVAVTMNVWTHFSLLYVICVFIIPVKPHL